MRIKVMDNFQEHQTDDFKFGSDLFVSIRTDTFLVVAIELGTNVSCFAFSLKDQPLKITSSWYWPYTYGSKASTKAPTCVLLEPDKSFHSFGFDAQEKYEELIEENEQDSWYFFENFNMFLDENNTFTRDTEIGDSTGKKKMPAQQIFIYAIKFLKDHCLNHLRSKWEFLLDKDIQWVVTIPPIWNDSVKQFMREACYKAGITDDQEINPTETEAAVTYFKFSSSECGNISGFKPGSKFMIVNLEDETGDITVIEVLDSTNLKQLHIARSKDWGGNRVNDNFMEMILRIVGNSVLQKFKLESKLDEGDLLNEFEIKKREIRPNSTKKCTLTFPVSFKETFEQIYEDDLKTVTQQSKFGNKITWIGTRMRVDTDVIKELFIPVSDSIAQHMRDILDNPLYRDVGTLFIVGNFAECPMIQEELRLCFDDRMVVIAENPGFAVLKGTVMFGWKEIKPVKIMTPTKVTKHQKEESFDGPSQLQDTGQSRSAQTPVEKKCTFCSNLGTYFCYNCKSVFCEQCRKAFHDKIPTSKNHTLTELKSVDPAAFRLTTDCDRHQLEYIHHCNQCNCLICSKCVTTNHKRHDISDIKTTVDGMRLSVSKAIAERKTKLKSLADLIDRIESRNIPDVKNEADKCVDEINTTAEEIKAVVDSIRAIKISEVEDRQDLEIEQINNTLSYKKRIHRQQTEVCGNQENLLNEKHDISFFTSYQALKREVHDFDDTMEDVDSVLGQGAYDRKAFLTNVVNALASKYKISFHVTPEGNPDA